MRRPLLAALMTVAVVFSASAQSPPTPWAGMLSAADVGPIGTVFNARDAMTACDGTTDDQMAFNNLAVKAGEASRSGSGRSLIYLPPSDRPCILSRPINLPSNVILFAAPGTVTLKPTGDSTSDTLLLLAGAVKNVLVYGVDIDGGLRDVPPIASKTRLALVYASQNIVFDHVSFHHARGIALEWSAVSDTSVRNSRFDDDGNYWEVSGRPEDRLAAINWDCGDVVNKNISVTGNHIANAGLDAISICNADGVTVANNDITNDTRQYQRVKSTNYPAGVYLVRSKNATISNNSILGVPGGCIDVADATNVSISGNTGEGCGSAGASVAAAQNVQVFCNTLVNNAQSTLSGLAVMMQQGGITVFAPGDNIVIGQNRLDDSQSKPSQQWGIQGIGKPGQFHNVEIRSGNDMLGNARGQITQNLQSAVVQNNSQAKESCAAPATTGR